MKTQLLHTHPSLLFGLLIFDGNPKLQCKLGKESHYFGYSNVAIITEIRCEKRRNMVGGLIFYLKKQGRLEKPTLVIN